MLKGFISERIAFKAFEFIYQSRNILKNNNTNTKKTKNLLINETKNGEKKIPKKEIEIEFEIKGKKIKIKGERILFKPEDRIKMFWRKKNE